MTKLSNRHYVYLTGGLGNQLFQLSAALKANSGRSTIISLDINMGNPRKGDFFPDLAGFSLPEGVEFLSKPVSLFVQKTAGYLLRMGIEPKTWEKTRITSRILRFFGKMTLSWHYRKIVNLLIAENVGFTEVSVGRNNIQIGYFQSYRYLEDKNVLNQMDKLTPSVKSEKLERLISRARSETPIFVHFRFQDYLAEHKFGLPSKSYYEVALRDLDGMSRKIWVFSDDLKLAKEKVPSAFRHNCHFVEDDGLSPAQLLHLFRFGGDYVIANSTFSWWGAQLRFDKRGKVIVPEPWFLALPEPRDLIPSDWKRVRS